MTSRRDRDEIEAALAELEESLGTARVGFDVHSLDSIDPADAEAAYVALVTPPATMPAEVEPFGDHRNYLNLLRSGRRERDR